VPIKSTKRNLYQRGNTWWGRLKVRGREYRRSHRTIVRSEAEKRLEAWRKLLVSNGGIDGILVEGFSFEKRVFAGSLTAYQNL
jgi:hypothetical protein